jgi:alpha-L-fucosidase
MLRISGLNNQVVGASSLREPSRKLPVGREHDTVTVTLPPKALDENDSVIVMEISGQLNVAHPLITQGSDSPFELDYLKAVTSGRAEKRFNRGGGFHISKWKGPEDSVAWRLLLSQTGVYRVRVQYAARKGWEGSRYVVRIGSQSLAAAVKATGDWYEYRTFDLGSVNLSKAGEYAVSVRPATASDHNLMYFKSLELKPASTGQ